MFEHIVSPDGNHVWCEDYDAPDELKSKWIPIEEWNKEFENKIKCPLCSGFLQIITYEWEGKVIEDFDDPCNECEEDFDLVSRTPLSIRHDGGDIYRCKIPIELANENYNIKGEVIIQVGGNEKDEGLDNEEKMELFDEAIHNFPNEFIQNLNERGGLVFFHEDAEWVRENRPVYVLKDDSYHIENEEE